MRVLLTGATGLIGSHLAATLLAQGHRVVAAGRRQCADPHIGFVEANMDHDTEKEKWLSRLTEIDVVINTVGIFRESPDQTFAALHSAVPRALFAACAEAGVRFVVQVSALGADEGASSAYHLSKKEADDFLTTLPLRSCIVQPSLVYGTDGASSRMFRTIATMPAVLRFGSAPQRVQPVHIDDVVGAIVALLHAASTPARLPLVGPRSMEFTEYLSALRRAMGLGRLHVFPLPGRLARLIARATARLPGSPITPDALDMLARGNSADPGPITRLLGRAPRDVEQFIRHPWMERRLAQLGWLLPLLRVNIAAVWIWTAVVSAFIYPAADSYLLLARSGMPAVLGPPLLYGASLLDFVFGIGTLALPRRCRHHLWLAQLVLISFYTLLIAWHMPEFLIHPYGPLSKNLPMMAAIWALYELEKE